jgi:pimeloyl-ACP methyl ester carboxylesterase
VHVIGISLGGALSFHTLANHHEKISRIDAYNPPGLYSHVWKKDLSENCIVNIYCQKGDPISQMGTWPTGKNVSIYSVMSHQKGVSENMLSSHARAFTGCQEISILRKDPGQQNASPLRRFFTILHQVLCPFFIFLPACCIFLIHRFFRTVHKISVFCIKRLKQ